MGWSRATSGSHGTTGTEHLTILSRRQSVVLVPYIRKSAYELLVRYKALMAISPTTRKAILDGGQFPTHPGLLGNSCQPSSDDIFGNTGTFGLHEHVKSGCFYVLPGSCMVYHPRQFHFRVPCRF
jgi:hypothetical protein